MDKLTRKEVEDLARRAASAGIKKTLKIERAPDAPRISAYMKNGGDSRTLSIGAHRVNLSRDEALALARLILANE